MKKRIPIIIVSAVLAFAFSVGIFCATIVFFVNNGVLIRVYKDSMDEKAETLLLLEMENYVSDYSQYNTYTYYSKLNKYEKIVYHSFEYALDNSLQYVMICKKLNGKLTYSPEDILYFLSLDSPIVEQNLLNITDSYKTKFKEPFDLVFKEQEGVLVGVSNFTEEKLAKKNEAIKKAEEIVASVPTDYSEKKKVEYIYKKLGSTIKYITYEEEQDKNYLYDALCDGKSNCDGFANAFSLVCNMVNINCVEKIYSPKNGEDGHTWNSFECDGKWYNADVSTYEDIKKMKVPFNLYLGFKDSVWPFEHLYSELAPECVDMFAESYVFIQGEALSQAASKIKKQYEESKNYVIVIWGENMNPSDRYMNTLAEKMMVGFTYYGFTGGKEKVHCLYKFN